MITGARGRRPPSTRLAHDRGGQVTRMITAAVHEGNWPIHRAALMMRTEALRALGGWTGIPYDQLARSPGT